MKKKSYTLLIIGSILLIASITTAVITYNSSYAESLLIEDAAEKLPKQRPYAYSLAFVFLSFLLTLKGIFNAVFGVKEHEKTDVKTIAQTGLMAALCYIGFALFKIDIPVGTEKTAFHFGNVFCVLAALLLGGYRGGLAGAIGMSIGDLTTSYVTSAPKTFILKFLIGYIVGFVAHNIFKLNKAHSHRYVTGVTIGSSATGMLFNIIADPLVGYLYKTYLLGIPQDLAKTLAKLNFATTTVNAVVAIVMASIFYLALRIPLRKTGIIPEEEQ
ncbi:MAG: ECF transporter S component [Lachnospiraceae bacterium]|nr:ECF transporter S component [Lachnospiraceae bacterium]